MKPVTLLLFVAALAAPTLARAQGAAADPLASFSHTWEDDQAWYDGKAEVARYDATRMIYGKLRRYVATLYTNKEAIAAEPTFTKSSNNEGRPAFKHHLREDIATENYAYHYSTMAYVGTDDLKSLKLDVGSIEDCGTTFKQYIHHADDLTWRQFSYFPDEGARQGEYQPPTGFAFQDALSVVLRGFPFSNPPKDPVTLHVLPDQTSNKLAPHQPVGMQVTYEGRETLTLPIGQVEAHHLRVRSVDDQGQSHDYWFAAEGAAPWLHVMVQYTGPDALTYSLRSLERDAYWERD